MNHPDLSKLFHYFSKGHSRHHSPTSKDKKERPEEWTTTFYKTYPRLPSLDLPDINPRADFFDLIKKRTSRHDFSRTPLTKDDVGSLLKYSCGNTEPMEEGRFHRAYPSGGARFPLEIYLIIFRDSGDLKAGLYHYNVKSHQLDILWNRQFLDENIDELFIYPWVKNAGMGIVMTSIFWRNQSKYGERGYRHVFLEAGHIGQNLYLISEALGLKCCAMAGTHDESLEKLIDIDGITESVVYSVVIGK